MTVSARLDEETNAMLEKTARLLRTTKTEVLRDQSRRSVVVHLRNRGKASTS